ncbi:hypothetical protein C7389_11214 [Azoarcus indigens]|uniref:BNR repeat protein n=2 Tax=Azoarcus indigens TaxID=29545 RepID=A0A4R6DVI1_9RHOO|nr:hypothetical protein C7389_11214 [Azoarcus indigens]
MPFWTVARGGVGAIYTGRRAFIGWLRPAPRVDTGARACPTVIHNYTGDPPEAPANELVNRWLYGADDPWLLYVFHMGRDGAKGDADVISAALAAQSCPHNDVPAILDGAVPVGILEDGTVAVAMVIGATEEGRADDYGFQTVRLGVGVWRGGAGTVVSMLPIPDDTAGEHSYVAGPLGALAPGVMLVPVVELWTPCRFQHDPELPESFDPTGRILLYRSTDYGATWGQVDAAAWMDGLPDAPEADPTSRTFDDPSILLQRVAWKASGYGAEINAAMCAAVFGSWVAPAPGAAVFFSPLRLDGGGYQLRAFHSGDSGSTWAEVAMPLIESATLPFVRAIVIRPGVLLARVQMNYDREDDGEVIALRSADGGLSWEETDLAGLDIELTQVTLGMFVVTEYDAERAPDQCTVAVPVVTGGKAVLYASTDDGASWQKAARMFPASRRADDRPFVAPPGTLLSPPQSDERELGAFDSPGDLGVCFYVGPYRSPAPANLAAPWWLDEALQE